MIEFLCTIAGLIAGGAIVASIMGIREQYAQDDLQHQVDNINLEKLRGLTSQLRTISGSVLDNVIEHSDQIKLFGDELSVSDSMDANTILMTVDRIIAANQKMQHDLDNAQRQLIDQQEVIAQTTMQAKTDPLTGLANRRALEERMLEFSTSSKSEGFLGLLLLDIDHFKRFNDTYGHLTGDAVLTSFARNIAQAAGEASFAARYGGEEFAVFLQANSERELIDKAALIRQYSSEQKIAHEDLELTVTASAGLCFVQPGDNLSIAYERADEGLYKAKELGRNRGQWLDQESWKPFPAVNTELLGLAPRTSYFDPSPQEDSNPNSPENSVEIYKSSAGTAKRLTETKNEQADLDAESDNLPALMDLPAFIEIARDHLNQLQRMDMPAAFMMIETPMIADPEECKSAWQQIVSLVKAKIRSNDLLCHFRPMTMGILLPGCSAELAYERAGELKRSLSQSLSSWELPVKPTKTSVVVSHVLEKEEIGNLLNRMESALEDSQQSSEKEIAIHDGYSTQCLEF